jgi:YgiT-type zinc finger domain-containing protein
MSIPLRIPVAVPRNFADAADLAGRAGAPAALRRAIRPVPDLDETLPIAQGRWSAAEELPMRCLRCQGRVERSTAPVVLEHGGCRVSWDAIPAWVCTRCEHAYFEPREVEFIRHALAAFKALRAAPGT